MEVMSMGRSVQICSLTIFEGFWWLLKMELTLSWVHTKLQPSGLSTIVHQNLRFNMLLTIIELFPPPTQALQVTSSGCDFTKIPLEQLIFHKKSKYQRIRSLTFSCALCFSLSPHTKGSFLLKRNLLMMQSSELTFPLALKVALRLQILSLRFYLKNSRLGWISVECYFRCISYFCFIQRWVLDIAICCFFSYISLLSVESSFFMALSFCLILWMEAVQSSNFYNFNFSLNFFLRTLSSFSFSSDLSLSILAGLTSLVVRERVQSMCLMFWVAMVRKLFFFLSSSLILLQISLMQFLYAFFLVWQIFQVVTVNRLSVFSGESLDRRRDSWLAVQEGIQFS